jgi:hypothetical protein
MARVPMTGLARYASVFDTIMRGQGRTTNIVALYHEVPRDQGDKDSRRAEEAPSARRLSLTPLFIAWFEHDIEGAGLTKHS